MSEEDNRNFILKKWIKTTTSIEHKLESWLSSLGRSVGTHPWRFIIGTLVVLLISGAGVLNFSSENEGERLWIPQDSRSALHRDYVSSLVGKPSKAHFFIAHGRGEQKNVLNADTIRSLFDVHDYVTNSSDGYNFNKDCSKNAFDQCEWHSVIRFWGGNRTIFEADIANQADPETHIRQVISGPGEGFVAVQGILFGKSKFNGSIITETFALQSLYLTEDSDAREDWELDITDRLLAYRAENDQQEHEVVWMMASSVDVELAKSLSDDTPLMMIAYVLMITFLSIATSRWLFSLNAILGVLIGMGIGYLISMGIGVPFTSLAQVLPFILVGNGVDDILVVTALLRQIKGKNPGADVPTRFEQTFKNAGLTITITSFTNVFAFLMGVLTSIPAIEYFCAYAALSSLFIWVMQLTFIAACLVLDERRQDKKPKNKQIETKEMSAGDRFMKEKYGVFITKKPVKVIVLILFAGIFAANIYSVSKVNQGFDLRDVAPDESFVRDFLGSQKDDFSAATFSSVKAMLVNIDYEDKENQKLVEDYLDTVSKGEYFTPQYYSWYNDFKLFYSSHPVYNATLDEGYLTNKTLFYQALEEFLNIPGYKGAYGNSIHFDKDGNIEASSVTFYHVTLKDSELEKKALQASEALDNAHAINKDAERGFLYSIQYVFWTQFLVMYDELISSYLLSGLAIFIICSALMVHPLACLIVTFVIGMVDIAVLGSLNLWGLDLNAISVINLIMSIGFISDYTSHTVHAFLNAKGTRDERVQGGLGVIGVSVTLGGFTTLLGVLPLVLSGSEVFRTFFKMFLMIVGYGVVHGLILVPVILSLIGPYIRLSDKNKTSKEDSISESSQPDKKVDQEVQIQLDDVAA